MNSEKTADPANNCNLLLKHLTENVKEALMLLYNRTLDEGAVPKAWKQSVVLMLKKKSDDLKNPKDRSV